MDIFSKIAAGEIPSYKCAESEKFYAFLDINPVVQAHTLVIPRREVDYIFDMEDGELAEFDRAATEAADLVGALVAAMAPPDRDIFLRKYYLLQSGKEIAAALGMSVESVNTRLSRGRDRLRRELTEKGVYSHA